MKDFRIFDLQSNAIAGFKRDYWNAVMIAAILYGVSIAVGTVSSMLMAPFQALSGIFAGMSIFSLPYTIINGGSSSIPLVASNIGLILGPLLLMSLLPAVAGIAMEPVNAGARLAYLDITAGGKAKAETLFATFKRFWRFVGAFLWHWLFVFLWSLLFLIPGIIKSFSYFMMPYLVAEYPDLPVQEAMKLSMRITMGYKDRIFYMYLLLFAWGLLTLPAAILTCGLGGIAYSLLWLAPLTGLLSAAMYNRLKMLAFEEGRISAKELHIVSTETNN